MNSPLRTFFLTTIPGLESAAHLELCDKWVGASDFFSLLNYPEVQFFKGGIEFQAPLHLGLELNRYLRVPSRMLLREKNFHAGSESLFLKGLESIDWSLYFSKKMKFDFQFTSKASKISLKRQVQKCLEKVLKPFGARYLKGETKIFVRILEDQCNISLDCSGELNFKRGNDKQGSIASLRESTASALLRVLFQGLKEPFQLIDPMCGSGTFLVEALQMNQKLKREFSFENFPCYQVLTPISLLPSHYNSPKKVFGFDIHPKAVELSQRNGQFFSAEKYQVQLSDLFDSPAVKLDNNLKKIVVLNPPWGKRLPGSSQDVLRAVVNKFNPDRVGYLIPTHWKIHSGTLEKVRDLAITNSGVENRFLVFVK